MRSTPAEKAFYLAVAGMLLVNTQMAAVSVGNPAPGFSGLCGVDGKSYSLEDFKDKKVVVVIFSCNHCPTVKAYEDRMVAIQRDYARKGVTLVAINPNDEKSYPEDGFEEMVVRAREKGFNFPYLRDQDQSVARAWGPQRTPEVFVLDKRRIVRYHGCIDDDVNEPQRVRRHYLREAIAALLARKPVPTPETEPVGCTVKWIGK